MLYHGTIESFDRRKLRTGGDGVFWTAKQRVIAKSYIPKSGVSTISTVERLVEPESIGLLGIPNGVLSRIDQASAVAARNRMGAYRELQTLRGELRELDAITGRLPHDHPKWDEYDRVIAAMENAEKVIEDNPDTGHGKRMKLVINKLRTLGFELPDDPRRIPYSAIRYRIVDGRIAPASYKDEGRLLTIELLADAKVYDMRGVGDLMEPAYNMLGTFRQLESRGFDGVLIDDYAQTEYYGNYGHESIGFFKGAVSKLVVKQVEKATHPGAEEFS